MFDRLLSRFARRRPPVERSTPRPYRPDTLLAACGLLLPDDPSLAAEVHLAIAHPDAYPARFGARLAGRTVPPVAGADLAWIALLDALEARGRLAVVDWDDPPEFVMEAVDHLLRDWPPDPARWAWVPAPPAGADPDDDPRHAGEFLPAVGTRLLPHGLVLATFDLDADQYAFAVLDAGPFPTLRALVAAAGFKLEPFTQDSPM